MRLTPVAANLVKQPLSSIVLACLVLLGAMPAWAGGFETPSEATLSEGNIQKLEAGGQVVKVTSDGGNRGEVIGVVNAPTAQVWRLLMNYDDFVRWFPDQKESKTVSRQGSTSVLQGVVDLPWPFTNRSFRIRDTNVTETVGGETHYHNGWTYVPDSGNIVDTTGFFYVTPFKGDPNRSLVRIVIKADFGIPVPDFVLNWGSRRMFPRIIEAIRRASPAPKPTASGSGLPG